MDGTEVENRDDPINASRKLLKTSAAIFVRYLTFSFSCLCNAEGEQYEHMKGA